MRCHCNVCGGMWYINTAVLRRTKQAKCPRCGVIGIFEDIPDTYWIEEKKKEGEE